MRLWDFSGGGGMDFQGEWDVDTTYYLGQTVRRANGLYIALDTSIGSDPALPNYGPEGVQAKADNANKNTATGTCVTQQFTINEDMYLETITGFVKLGPGAVFSITDTKDGTVLFTGITTATQPGGQGAYIAANVTAGILPAGTYWVVFDMGTSTTPSSTVAGSTPPILTGSFTAIGPCYSGTANGDHPTLRINSNLLWYLTGRPVLPSESWEFVLQGVSPT